MLNKTLTALAEPTRLGAISILWDGEEQCLCDLMQILQASQSRMSRHMAALKSAGLVVDRRDRQWVRYRLNPPMPSAIFAVFEAVVNAQKAEKRNAA